jgi:hypothetical protein
LEIKTNIFGQLELNYFCKEKFFDWIETNWKMCKVSNLFKLRQ